MQTTLTVTLIRGLPGSGKSTLAQRLPGVHLEADMFFINEQGEYRFQPEKLSAAHAWCQQRSEYWLEQGESIVVSNTFVRHWEMAFYKQLAYRYHAKLNIIVCQQEFGSIHDIEPAVIETMRRRWQN
ncbi:MAG: ATP-binding protein [Vibrio sp.]